ncbi:MAG: phosphonate C-P lyase system protein PhnG, partial [Paracoccaceae bacterium]|nr:phosphonate C-P lyase system protein PhnG [Paracoccaceae bacterium]
MTSSAPLTRKLGGRPHGQALSILARARAVHTAALAEDLIDRLAPIEVIHSRTGLVMLPMTDTVQGTDFHLGEVLVAEAQIRAGGVTGYGMVTGRDLEQAMAMALIDAAAAQGLAEDEITALLDTEAAHQAAEDARTLCAIAATRVEMETF